MGGSLSKKWDFSAAVPEGVESITPIWSPPESASSNIDFALTKYVKEYISVILQTSAQGIPFTIKAHKGKIFLYDSSGESILGMAKRFGGTFRIFRLEPNFPGQEPCGRLKRADYAPLYYHSLVKRKSVKAKTLHTGVFQLGTKEIYRIRDGPVNSFEKTCVDPITNEEYAFWKYSNKKNRVQVFQNQRNAPDVGLIMLLAIVADMLDVDEMMDKAAVSAVSRYHVD